MHKEERVCWSQKINLVDFIRKLNLNTKSFTLYVSNMTIDKCNRRETKVDTVSLDELLAIIVEYGKHGLKEECIGITIGIRDGFIDDEVTLYPDFFKNGEMLSELYKNNPDNLFNVLKNEIADFLQKYRTRLDLGI